MSEEVRNIKVTIEVDTNKNTYKREINGFSLSETDALVIGYLDSLLEDFD